MKKMICMNSLDSKVEMLVRAMAAGDVAVTEKQIETGGNDETII